MKLFNEEWVLKALQAKPIEMGWGTEDRRTENSKGLKMQEDKTEMLDEVTLTCSWCAGQQLKLANMCVATHCVGLLI